MVRVKKRGRRHTCAAFLASRRSQGSTVPRYLGVRRSKTSIIKHKDEDRTNALQVRVESGPGSGLYTRCCDRAQRSSRPIPHRRTSRAEARPASRRRRTAHQDPRRRVLEERTPSATAPRGRLDGTRATWRGSRALSGTTAERRSSGGLNRTSGEWCSFCWVVDG